MFEDGNAADNDGVVGVGADLAPATLVDAYRRGIFPWPHPDIPLPWFCPDPRAVIEFDQFHVSRSLRRRLRSCGWTTSVNEAFADVIQACAQRPPDVGTWITRELMAGYVRLAQLGWAHSFEVWDQDRLVGGMYGVLIGGVFTGESMFHRSTDASKVAIADAVERLRACGARLLDVQIMTSHLESLGARDVPRDWFLDQLDEAREWDVRLNLERRDVERLVDL